MWLLEIMPMVPMLSKRSLGLKMVEMIFWLAPKPKVDLPFFWCKMGLSFRPGWTWIQHRLYFTNTAVKFLMNVKKPFLRVDFRKIFPGFCKFLLRDLNEKGFKSEDLNQVTIKVSTCSFERPLWPYWIKSIWKKREITPSPLHNLHTRRLQ